MKDKATKDQAILLCKEIFRCLSGRGFYPALTGGLLYKDGDRKDIDIVIYRHRQNIQEFELKDLESFLSESGLSDFKHYGFVTKCAWNNLAVDLFNPESSSLSDEEYEKLVAAA